VNSQEQAVVVGAAGPTPESNPERLKILQVSSGLRQGGAERVAVSLHQGLQRRGQSAWMAVGRGKSDDPDVFLIPPKRLSRPWGTSLRLAADAVTELRGRVPGARRLERALRRAESPEALLDWWRGHEHFDYPGTATIPNLPPEAPDVIHCHNLHGEYFDLRRLGSLSRIAPIVLTLHDEWAFTGHCAGTLGCERWRIGCGSCPDLTIYPAVRRDATDTNWQVKRDIYADSRLYVSAPSKWLLDRARDSILAGGDTRWRVIPNGADQSVFRPGDKAAARVRLDLPGDALILLFAAHDARRNMFKDYGTVALAAQRAAEMLTNSKLVLVVLGDSDPIEQIENLEIRSIPYEGDPQRVAAYYQSADVYVHGAKADTAPLTVVEALATGLPVVATAVGGIPEYVRSLAEVQGAWTGAAESIDQATGVLVAPSDSEGMGTAIATLLQDATMRQRLGANAAVDAVDRFDFDRYVDTTLAWYREILVDWKGQPGL
jgi:glycosyltransferase involved in cell wall biosynthesis